MGTASTMACIAETLGMSLPGTAAIPAVLAERLVAAEESGRAAVAHDHAADPPVRDHHREVGRERVPPADGGRRLDQRHRAPDRDRRPPRHPHLERAAQRDLRRDAGAGRPEAGRRRLHGGFPRRRRRRRGVARIEAAAASRHRRRDRAHAGRAPGRTVWSGSTARSSAPSPTRYRRSAG